MNINIHIDINMNVNIRIIVNMKNVLGVGDHFQVLKVLGRTCTFRGWGTISRSLIKVSEGTCTVLRTYSLLAI